MWRCTALHTRCHIRVPGKQGASWISYKWRLRVYGLGFYICAQTSNNTQEAVLTWVWGCRGRWAHTWAPLSGTFLTARAVDGIEAKTQSGSPDGNWTEPYLPHLVWHRSRHGLSFRALWVNGGTQGTCLLVLLSAVSNDWEQRGSWEKAQDWKGQIERGKEMIGDWTTYWQWEVHVWFKFIKQENDYTNIYRE